MALPLWEECSWVKSFSAQDSLKYLQDKEDKVKKEKELADLARQKEEEDAENYRKQFEKSEKLKLLTSALLSPIPRSPVVPGEGAVGAENPEAPPVDMEENTSLPAPPLKVKKTSLFDDEEEESKPPNPQIAGKDGSKLPDLQNEETGDDEVSSRAAKDQPDEVKEDGESNQEAEASKEPVYPFTINPELNAKIFLHLGAGYKIPCDTLIVGQNEQLSDRNDDNAALVTLGGPVLEQELALAAPVQTGESVITSGGSLACTWIVHAIGPRFDERYLTAAEHALFSAYKTALVLALEKQTKDLIITCIYSPKKKYPRFDAAHIALRTVRKLLQHPSLSNQFSRIMFAVPTQDDYEIYSALLAAYFPRNEQELEASLNLLPKELGDEWGEITVGDRVLKVSAGPKPLSAEELEEYRRRNSNAEKEEAGAENGDETRSSNVDAETAVSGGTGSVPRRRQCRAGVDKQDPFLTTASSDDKNHKKKTGDGNIIRVGEIPKGMNQITHNDDEIRKAKVLVSFPFLSFLLTGLRRFLGGKRAVQVES
jgi:O-acetyl-ADP-ribose deacetylase (regulator of RNase III)